MNIVRLGQSAFPLVNDAGALVRYLWIPLVLLLLLAAWWWLRRLRRDPRLTPPSLFTAIGFSIAGGDEIADFASRVVRQGRAWPVAGETGGEYYQLASAGGAEFWTALNADQLIEAVTPFFRAGNRNALRILRPLADPEWRYEGSFEAEAADGAKLAFACPDFLLHAGGAFPQASEIALVGFLHDGELFADDAAFCGEEGDPRAPVCVCTPAGLLRLGKAPPSQTLIRGRVEESRLLKNGQTGRAFIWARLDVAPLTLDIVADPRLLPAAPQAGNVLEASVWLAGDWVEHRA